MAFNAPMLEGVWGALASRRGAIVTVERVVDDIRPWSHLVKIPCPPRAGRRGGTDGRAPRGAVRPGRAVSTPTERTSRYWAAVRDASRSDTFDDWIRHWVLEPADQDEYLARLGARAGRGAAGAGRRRLVDATTSATTRRTSTRAGRRLGAGRGPTAPATSPSGSASARPTPCSPGRASPTSPRGWRCALARAHGLARRPHRRARHARATSRHRRTRSCSTTAASRPRPCSATATRCSASLSRGPGTTPAGVPRRGADRPLRQHQLDRHPGPGVPRRLRRRQRRRVHRGRGRRDGDADHAPHRGRGPLHHVAGAAGAGVRHRPRDVREGSRREVRADRGRRRRR